MVSLTFYGGVDEIGGNKILMEDDSVRFFFDFGEAFSCGCDYFTGWLSPRRANGLGDYFEFGLLPKLKGLYSAEQLQFSDLPYVDPEFDGVFLSHAHFDHVNHIQFLDPKIPVYLGEGTRFFLEAMEKTSPFCNYREHDYLPYRTGDKIEVEGLIVEPIHVDHSIPAAYGFIVHTREGIIVYTGDLRLHGSRKDLTEDFLDQAESCEPTALIIEGTKLTESDKKETYSEQEVKEHADSIVSKTNTLVFVTHYSRDMDRFRTFYEIAKSNSRQLVISPKTAYLLETLVNDKRLNLPDPLKDQDILVYYRRKKSGKFEDTDYPKWERKYMNKMINSELVRSSQSTLVMNLDFYHFAELIDIKPGPRSHFIHSMSEPFSEEDMQDQVMHNWINHFKMKFHQLHSSGHADKTQLASVVNRLNPMKLFPIHTENQRLFKKISKKTQIVKCAKKYPL